jgi:hypothetical protein
VSLVPGRTCGACMVCCITPLIDTPELGKLPNVPCVNCKVGGGCKIYQTRPEGCRVYHCGWRELGELDESWRPDRCGVLIEVQETGIPEHYIKRRGLRLTIVGPLETIFQEGFLDYVMRLVQAQMPVFLCVAGPPGYQSLTVFLNDVMRDAVAARELRHIGAVFAQVLEHLSKIKLKPVVLQHRRP